MPPCTHRLAFLLLRAACFAALASAAVVRAQSVTDPRITSWQIGRGSYARVWETAADKNSNNAVSTWPRAGLTNNGGGVSTASYSDVQRVAYSANFVYIYTSGLASYTMGHWLTPNGMTYMSWPSNRAAIHRIPRTPTIPTTKQRNNGSGGVLVNGVFVWQNGDAQSYAAASSTATTASISMTGDGIWNRLAGVAEAFNFDSAYGHQPANGAYHNHVDPKALRYQLGDNVSYNAATKTYSETNVAAPSRHSPIIGWANDGLPIYGPYGYSDPMSATSPVRRMTSGFVKRDGTNGTVNLATTGRTTLPKWAAEVQGRSQTLASTQSGPAVTATYALGPVSNACSIGLFAEDYEYLGDLGKTQGVDFDLNRQNVRFCVTPEFPAGTYAYFTCIDATGATVFPDIINQEYFGTAAGGQGTVTTVTETVTDYARGGQAYPISVTAVAAGAGVLVSWTSVEGGTYAVATSADGTTFTNIATGLTSAGLTTTYNATAVANHYRVTLTALAAYNTGGTGGISGLDGNGTAQFSTVGSSGTARLVNLATRAQVGGTAGTPIAGFVISGTGSKRVLTRAVGPGLTAFGVVGALADPSLTLVSGNTTVGSNDNWLAADATTFTAVGAFALTAGSRDAAIVSTLSPASYTTPVGAGTGSGITLLEVYDADSAATPTARLVNASTRAFVGTGESVLIPGFVVSGTGTVKLLIRAAGPALAAFGVTGTLADPQISLFAAGSTAALATNNDWATPVGTGAANAAALAAAASNAGAFAFTSGSRDAAMLVDVSAGSYTATVSGVGATTGTALVEIYVVP